MTISSNNVESLKKYIYEYALNYFKNDYLKCFIEKNYKYLNIHEKEKIINETPRYLEFKILKQDVDNLELEEGININLNGIIIFRFKEFKKYINETINILTEKIIFNNEYSKVLKIFKLALILNKPTVEEFHIVFSYDNDITICYKKNKGPVGANRNFFDNDLLFEDFLIDSILELCPSRIVVHNINYIKNRNLLKTLHKLYEYKLEVCPGCRKCLYMHCTDTVD